MKYSNQTRRSTSDPDARLYRKGKGKESKLSCRVHDLIDTKSRVILSRKVSEAHSSAERRVCIEMLRHPYQPVPRLRAQGRVAYRCSDERIRTRWQRVETTSPQAPGVPERAVDFHQARLR